MEIVSTMHVTVRRDKNYYSIIIQQNNRLS